MEMMNLEVEVISTEIIKPSSPTPQHLRHYQLSFLDQISPPVYNPLLLFYPADDDHHINNNNTAEPLINVLKQSLSQVLTFFYPLAGRFNKETHLSIDCNDEGIPFKEAKVNCQLSHLLQNPNPNELNKLLPFALADDAAAAAEAAPPLGIQFNVFDCGGIGIGVCISHKVGDAQSLVTFVKSWAATARGEKHTVRVDFVSATLIPAKKKSSLLGFEHSTGITKDKIVTKRLVFTAAKIEDLRSKYSQERPSRVEALSAFIWTRFVAATKPSKNPDHQRFYTIIHAVNLRQRMEPPLPDYSFGNLYRPAITIPRMRNDDDDDDDDDDERYGLGIISQVRESLHKIEKEFVKMLQDDGDEHLGLIRERAEQFVRGEMVSFSFTSLCRFPLYESDFGRGKPVWVGSASLSFKNLVTFMDTASGDGGVEAWVNLKDHDMAKFQLDEELLKFAA